MSTAYKKVTSHGSVSIPIAIRRELGIEPRDPLVVETEQGRIILSPYQVRCTFCGTAEDVKPFCGKGICTGCMEKIGKREGDG